MNIGPPIIIGGDIGQDAEVDLSEWGGKAPTCAEAPGCPVCIK